MKGIIKPEDLPQNEKVYLKKSFDGWRVVYPMRNEDGSFNLKNFLTGGSIWNVVKALLIVAIILFVSWSYMHDTEVCRDLISHPCQYYDHIIEMCAPVPINNMPQLPLLNGNLEVINNGGL